MLGLESEEVKELPSVPTRSVFESSSALVSSDTGSELGTIDGDSELVSRRCDDDDVEQREYLTGYRLYMVMLAINLRVFLASLDQTIMGPIIPDLSNQFGVLEDIGWYVASYFAMQTAFQPLYSRLYVVDLKWPFFTCTILFEIGTVICATATSSWMFICGRAITGLGAAGGFFGSLMIISASVPLDKVPVWTGVYGAVYGLGALCGPIIGGSFVSHKSWQWAFWFQLPIGAVVLVITLFFLNSPPRVDVRAVGLQRCIIAIAREDWCV